MERAKRLPVRRPIFPLSGETVAPLEGFLHADSSVLPRCQVPKRRRPVWGVCVGWAEHHAGREAGRGVIIGEIGGQDEPGAHKYVAIVVFSFSCARVDHLRHGVPANVSLERKASSNMNPM